MPTISTRHELPAADNAWSEQRTEAIRAVARDAVATGDVPGVVWLVCHRGEIVLAEAAGLRDIDNQLPMERSTIFGIASMSKPITAVLALTLIEEGKIRLDDPITRWLPEFSAARVLRRSDASLDDTYPAPRAMTVEDLMTHRSGLAYGFMAPGPLGQALFSRFGMGIESPLAPDAWLTQLAELPLAYAPGERFNYGHSTDVLGFLAARVAGTTLRNALKQRLFEPLGMIDTDFWIPPAKRWRMAQNYRSPAASQFTRAGIAQFTADEAAAYTSGGQGLVSTVDDYLTFAKMLLNGGTVNGVQLLKPSTVDLMTSNRLTAEQREIPVMGSALFKAKGFGLGVSIVTDPQHLAGAAGRGSFGWPGGFGGWWQADPENELVLLWLQECVPGSPIATTTSPPRMPGARALIDFQKQTYAALAC